MRIRIAFLFAVAALAMAPSAVAAQEDESASCVAHAVHGPPGPPGLFRSAAGPDFPFPFGNRVSEVATTEGGSFEECVGS